MMVANRGDDLPVSAMPVDGTFPTGTTQYEAFDRRGIPYPARYSASSAGSARWVALTRPSA